MNLNLLKTTTIACLFITLTLFVNSCSNSTGNQTSSVDQQPETNSNVEENQVKVNTDLLRENGCLSCHSLDGTDGRGPTFKGIAGKTVIVIENGEEKELVVDETYLEVSILEPDKQVVKGYRPTMSSYKDEISDEDLKEIVGILKQL
jgi:cytochrome c551/c552